MDDDFNYLNLEYSHCQDQGGYENAAGPFGVLAGQSLYDVVTDNLNEQIRELRDVNARLTNTICDKDHEIGLLRQRTVGLSDSSEKDSSGLKITELAKAKRELTAKYEAEHSRVLKLQAEKTGLEIRLADSTTDQATAAPVTREREDNIRAKQVTKAVHKIVSGDEASAVTLHHRLQVAIEKASVATQENQCLKQQLRRITQALEQEVGPNVDISTILKENGATYRGRDQQIQLLRAKLETMKKQLDAFRLFDQENGDVKSVRSAASPVKLSGAKPEQNEYNARHREQLNQDDHKRRADFMALTDDHHGLQRKHVDLKTKLTAAKARIDYLSKENGRLTQFNRHVLDTCQKDAELIRYFQTTITELRSAFSKTTLPPLLPDPGYQLEKRPARSNVSRSSTERSSVDRTISRKISNMESQLKDLREVHSLTFEQLERSASSGDASEGDLSGRTVASMATSRPRSAASSRSTGVRKPATAKSTTKRGSCQTRRRVLADGEQWTRPAADDSLDEEERSDQDPNLPREDPCQLSVFENSVRKCEKITEKLQSVVEMEDTALRNLTEDLSMTRENCSLLHLQAQHVQLGLEIDAHSQAPRHAGADRARVVPETYKKVSRAEVTKKGRPAFSCYTR